ncbi:uncharacterized protein LOC133910957 [Phragmites australis]|uniref:uncharacterized protein LOC133910957 n=1 Tax=Phragmites australis TaxID=29695 RepID=UPI002D796DF5|nr:uncharacterized protein LOC133910957 [Phragmites australis]
MTSFTSGDQFMFSSDSSDDEEELMMMVAIEEEELRTQGRTRHRGSVLGHAVIDRGHQEGAARLFRDYFSNNPVYGDILFRRRFRMSRALFLRIATAVENHDPWFRQKRDATGKLGLSPLQKMTAAIRQLAYGVSSDAVDEYVRIGGSTAMLALTKFVEAVVFLFSDEYLRSPTAEDTARLLAIGEQRGFPGMLGSIDCMHWVWKNCPKAWHGAYTGHTRKPSIVLEAVASYDLWIWHAFFGMPGSLNDINVLHRSNIFSRLTDGTAPPVSYTINGTTYDMGYYLGDEIYPEWATIVKPIPSPRGNKSVLFSAMQAAVRKDVERAFGVLQSRFAIIRGPGRIWEQRTLHNIMTACIIMHNMIIEDERGGTDVDEVFEYMGEKATIEGRDADQAVLQYIEATEAIRNRAIHHQLRDDLVHHIWSRHGAQS